MADVVFQTSGSTGAAKEIVRTESSLQADAHNLVALFSQIWGTDPGGSRSNPVQTDDGCRRVAGAEFLVVASVRPEHMFGALWRVRIPEIAGFRVAVDTIVSVEQLVSVSAGDRSPSLIFITTPSFLEKAITHPDFPSLKGAFRAIVTSGSALRSETSLAVAKAVGTCPLEIYGSTETGTVAWRIQSVGTPFTVVPHVAVDVREDGRLVVDSPFAMARPFVMGDLAEKQDERHFLLGGRADRCVKILENPVSLTEIETALSRHPFVKCARAETYGTGVPRVGALVVLSETGVREVAHGGTSVAAALRTFLEGKVIRVAVPRRFRIVRELPMNEQGKMTAAAVRAALGVWCREPVVVDWRTTPVVLRAEFVFTADMECFDGHFPGVPILPGVAQLHFLRHFARQAFPDWPDAATYRRLKFQKIIRPGATVSLEVARRGAGFAFSLTGSNGLCSSGLVERSVT